jgi:Rrf2 family protein
VKLSTKGRYGLRAFIDLAVYGAIEPVPLASVAARQEISYRYLEQLMGKLKRAGLVKSIRGVNGGYLLAKAANDISVGEVLRALEGDLKPVECAAIDADVALHCSSVDGCVSKIVWQRIHDSITNAVDNIFIGELVEESKAYNE